MERFQNGVNGLYKNINILEEGDNMITKEFIEQLSYTDFVGFVNQWNVLPGAYTTLSKWINYGRINENSNILQAACTTGFQLREISKLTNCIGKGFDLSQYAIDSAIYNKNVYLPNSKIEYIQCDGYKYVADTNYTHVVIGGGLKFFPDPQKMLDKCIEFMGDEGYILASPFYIKNKLPDELINKAKMVFGIKPTYENYKDIMDMYNKFEIIYEERNDLIQETDKEINYYCKCTTDEAVKRLKINDLEIYNSIYKRLLDVKNMSNELRPYQGYIVLVLRYRKNIYPNRWVELF